MKPIAPLMLALVFTGCGPDQPVEVKRETSLDKGAAEARTMRLWARSCALCHVDGNAGAPRVGNTEEWRARLAQGGEVLLKHTVEGLNSMPPLGYCMACERQDFVDMIAFMTAGVQTGEDQ